MRKKIKVIENGVPLDQKDFESIVVDLFTQRLFVSYKFTGESKTVILGGQTENIDNFIRLLRKELLPKKIKHIDIEEIVNHTPLPKQYFLDEEAV